LLSSVHDRRAQDHCRVQARDDRDETSDNSKGQDGRKQRHDRRLYNQAPSLMTMLASAGEGDCLVALAQIVPVTAEAFWV
jgi:hypothetical protein